VLSVLEPVGADYGRRAVSNFFETSKKMSKKRPLGRFVRGLRALFNLALILGVSAVIVVACLYLFVAKEFEGDLDRTYPELAENSYVYNVEGNVIEKFPLVESRETVYPARSSPSRTGASTTTGASPPRDSPARRGPTSDPGTSMRVAPRLRSSS